MPFCNNIFHFVIKSNMYEIGNRNHYWLPKLDSLLPITALILCAMSFSPGSLERGCISITVTGQSLENGLELSFEICAPLTKRSQKSLVSLKFKTRSISDLIKIYEWYSMVAYDCQTFETFFNILLLFIYLFI